VRALGRERLKDTSLDYGTEAGRAYAERRGLVPESEIVLRERQAEAAREQPAPRRSRFAGLKLNAAPIRPDRARQAERARSRTSAWESELSRAVGQFAEAVEDARRLVREDLPVLPHQQAAVEAGIAAIVAAAPGFDRSDVVNAFDTHTALITPAVLGPAGREAAIVAIEETREQRLALEAKARAAMRQWAVLEQRYDQAERGQERDTARQAVSGMEAFAEELKRDPQLESLLRQRGREFGVVEGSRLDRMVRSQRIEQELARELGLRHGRDLGMGRS